MKIYRVTFTTQLLVEAGSEEDAERIGSSFLSDEVRNGGSEVYRTEEITSPLGLLTRERGSLPWRDWKRVGEPEITVDDILRVQSSTPPG